jgi:starch synthase
MDPYHIESEIASIARSLPEYVQEQGMEIRVLMPRFGNINERRHRLHEVVRLSGINIIIDSDDYPLMIKVASLPGARMQVYFLDNEDFFKRKGVFRDDKEKFYDDNSERMIFFCKGVIETVKKFGWPPDIIHCHGWMTSLIPLYLKTAYQNEPVFQNSTVVYSVYKNSFKESLPKSFIKKAPIKDSISPSDLELFKGADNTSLNIGGANYSDAIILGSEEIDKDVNNFITNEINKPVLEFVNDDEYLDKYHNFYESCMRAPV